MRILNNEELGVSGGDKGVVDKDQLDLAVLQTPFRVVGYLLTGIFTGHWEATNIVSDPYKQAGL